MDRDERKLNEEESPTIEDYYDLLAENGYQALELDHRGGLILVLLGFITTLMLYCGYLFVSRIC